MPLARGAASDLPSVDVDFEPRPAVIDRLDESTGRIAAVMAPAGYGSTSHVAYWAARQDRPVAWVKLQPWSDDPASLLASVVAAVAGATGLDVDDLPNIRGNADHVHSVVLPAVLRVLSGLDHPVVVVVDKAHHLDEPLTYEVVDALARHLPADSTMVLVGQAVPAAMLARWRVRPGLVEVRAADLALDAAAATRLMVRRGIDRVPSDVDAASLVAATDGWPVGIILAAVVAKSSGADDWSAITADHVVTDYVASEWLDLLPPVERAFLRDVSLLETLHGDLCDHVAERSGSGQLLRELHDDRSLLVALNRRHDVFRMHTALREALILEAQRLDGDDVRRRHRRASDWYLSRGDVDMAVHHALKTEDREFAVALLAEHAPVVHASGRVETVARWIDALTASPSETDPRVCQLAAVTSFARLAGREARAWVEAGLANTAALEGEGSRLWWELTAFGTMITPSLAADEARAAAAALPPGRWRAVALTALGGHLFIAGEYDEAEEVLCTALAETELARLASTQVGARSMLALLLEHAGDRPEWHEHARAALGIIEAFGLEHSPATLVGYAASSLSAAVASGGAVPAEWHRARRGLALLGNDAGCGSLQARIALARTALRCGDVAAARTLTVEAREQLRIVHGATAAEAQVQQLEGQLATASSLPAFGASAISSAELRVLYLLPTNLTLAEIAERLYVSRNTVKSHSLSIYRKLGVESRRQCVDVAREAGLLTALVAPTR